jgi:hypothetical protein
MKNLKRLSGSIALLTAILFFGGCPMNPDEGTKSGAASVTGITVAGVVVTPVPEAVPQSVWGGAGFSLFDLEAGQVGQVVINDAASLTDAQIVVAASAGAKVRYAATEIDVPQDFRDANTVTLANGGYLCIQVTSENGATVNYYVVGISLAATNTTLTGVTVGGIQAALGTSNANWAQAEAGSVGLSKATKNNAAVAVTKANTGQTVKYAKVTGNAVPSFSDTATFSFEDGDFLYIEVTAENGVNKAVYKLQVQVDRDTTLSALSIGGVEVTSLGTPAAALADVTAGTVLFNAAQPTEGYAVSATATDTEASVEWAGVATDTNTATFGTTSPIEFQDQGYLYVKVVAANGTTTAYYKIQVNLLMTATIKYGQPEIKASSEKYIDPKWDSVTETYQIAKVAQESSGDYKAAPTTTGIAKALFDEDGLYLYVVVTDPAVDTTGGSAHLKDSVELFINEGVDGSGELIKAPVGYADKGGQYRVDAVGAISGDPATASSAVNPSKVSAWETEGGYVVIFQAPWRFLDQYPLEDGKKVGFELQINACSNSGRDGVVVWNNIAHTNYQNVSDYGEAVLDLNGNVLKINAKNPVVSAHPASKAYTPPLPNAADALTVTATSPDSGTLTYQWYSNTVNSYEGGTAISAQTGTSYTPPLTEGTTYYWVAVTNTITDNGDGGTKTAVLPSGIASIVVSGVPLIEKIEAGGSSVPVYRFTPPGGSVWGDYKTITFTVMLADEASNTESAVRAHIMGNYPASNFGDSGTFSKLSSWNDARLVNISNGGAMSTIIGTDYTLFTWKELSYPIVLDDIPSGQKDNSYARETYYPASDAADPFYFGLGLSINPNSAADRTVTYYIKDVALVKADGTKLPADDLATVFGNTTLGQLKCIFSNAAGAKVIRTLEAEPSAPGGN